MFYTFFIMKSLQEHNTHRTQVTCIIFLTTGTSFKRLRWQWMVCHFSLVTSANTYPNFKVYIYLFITFITYSNDYQIKLNPSICISKFSIRPITVGSPLTGSSENLYSVLHLCSMSNLWSLMVQNFLVPYPKNFITCTLLIDSEK